MKNRLNVIQINGIKGILFIIGAVTCLAAGFILFPGFVMKCGWNLVSAFTGAVPTIGLLQGTLLWGIMVVSYLILVGKKIKFVEFKSTDDLTPGEMDAVMQKIREERQAEQADLITKSIMRARELNMNARAREEMLNSWKALENTINAELEQNSEQNREEHSEVKH